MTRATEPNPASRARRVIRPHLGVRRRLLCALSLAFPFATGALAAPAVSWVDTSLSVHEKPVLMVGDTPFFYQGVQLRADKVRDRLGWNPAQVEALFALAAHAGFTVVNVPLLWIDVETARDRYDWTTLERYIDWSAKHGLRLELLWFGTNSDGEVQTLDGTPNGKLRVPAYVMEFAKVLNRDGQPITRNGLFQLDWCDPALLRRETEVLAEVMRFIAADDVRRGKPRTVVGMQIENEPQVGKMQGKRMTERSYGPHAEAAFAAGRWTDAHAFTLDVMFRYIDGVASAVKNSSYPVWTRVNCWSKTSHPQPLIHHIEAAWADGRAHLDFEGPDVYQSRPELVIAALAPWRTGRNFLMVMENSGAYPNAAALPTAALSANAAYNVYDLCSTDNHGLYVPQGTQAVPRGDHVAGVVAINRMLRGAWFDLATRRQGDGGSLFVFNPLSVARTVEEHTLRGVKLRYATEAAGQGIGVRRAADEWLLLSTRAGTFTLTHLAGPVSATRGHFGRDNRWVESARHTVVRAGDGVSLSLSPCDLVRLVLRGP